MILQAPFGIPPVVAGTSLIDSYSESNRSEDQLLGNENQVIGQCFTGNGLAIGSCQFYLAKVGTPTGNITAVVYTLGYGDFGTTGCPSDSGVSPTVLATSDAIVASTVSTTQALVTLTFSGVNQITLTNGTHYCIACLKSGTDSSNYIKIADDATSPSHAGNAFYQDTSAAPGFGSFSADVCFYVYST